MFVKRLRFNWYSFFLQKEIPSKQPADGSLQLIATLKPILTGLFTTYCQTKKLLIHVIENCYNSKFNVNFIMQRIPIKLLICVPVPFLNSNYMARCSFQLVVTHL